MSQSGQPLFFVAGAIVFRLVTTLFFSSDLADRTRHGPYNCVSGEKR